MSTTVEGVLEDVLAAVARAHHAAEAGATRVITTVRIESKPGGLELHRRQAETTNEASAGWRSPGQVGKTTSPQMGIFNWPLTLFVASRATMCHVPMWT